jgi:hypothetical protein
MKRIWDVVLAALVATVVIACGDAVMRPAAHLMVDAGHMLMDAGVDMLDGGSDAATDTDGKDGAIKMSDKDAQVDGMVADAQAQSCGNCTVAGPIEVQGPLKVVTADTDATRLKSGLLSDDAEWHQLAVGPFVLTDLMPEPVYVGSSLSRYFDTTIAAPGACSGGGTRLLEAFTGGWVSNNATASSHVDGHVSGARYLVPSGKVLCGRGTGTWSGFAPY